MEQPILKTPDEIEIMRVANQIVAKAHRLVGEMIKPGISTGEIDREVEKLIRDEGAIPTFKGYPSPDPSIQNYPASICASINEEVVHGIPSFDRILQDGQIISVDIGTKINGFCGDATQTFAVGSISKKAQNLVDTAKRCLDNAIKIIKPGIMLTEVCRAIQTEAESCGFSVVQSFVGHGIGRNMHEPPQIPNYVTNKGRDTNIPLLPGAVLAIEPMVNAGKADISVKKDGWTVITKDRSLSVHWEHSVAVTEHGSSVLSEI